MLSRVLRRGFGVDTDVRSYWKEGAVVAADLWPSFPAQRTAPSRFDGPVHSRAHDPDRAREIVSELLVPHRLWVAAGSSVDLDIVSARFGSVTAALVSYGAPVHVLTEPTTQLPVILTLRGRAASRDVGGESLVAMPGQAILFRLGDPAQITLSADCRLLCLMVPRATLEAELEQLLGRRLTEAFELEHNLVTEIPGFWQLALRRVLEELENPTGHLARPVVARHHEGLLVEGLLLTQPHNYAAALQQDAGAVDPGPVARAAELLRERCLEPWTVMRLAEAVDVSVRGLQHGFKRDVGQSPMAYLRQLRLQRAHALLTATGRTTVREVALDCGFPHVSRFAAAYREAFGEAPSETLARSR